MNADAHSLVQARSVERPTRLRLVGYVRVSTDRQVERGLGLAIQEKSIRAWARQHRHRLVTVVSDDGVSGTLDVAERSGLTAALRLLQDRKADALVIYRLDRLARSLTLQEAILSLVWGVGGSVIAVDTGEVPADDPTDPMRTFVRQVMGAAHQLERALVISRMRAGRNLKAERGGYSGNGSPPFGFRAEAGALVPDERERAAVALAVDLSEQGRSLREIASALEARGVRAKRSARWHPATVGRLLRRAAAGTCEPRDRGGLAKEGSMATMVRSTQPAPHPGP